MLFKVVMISDFDYVLIVWSEEHNKIQVPKYIIRSVQMKLLIYLALITYINSSY